eukprot:COSAG02_NODE_5186_length_4558_cov_15.067728_5_plen_124_part_00
MNAALAGHVRMTRVLLEGGANPDLVDKDDHRTAFHWACRQGHTGVAVALVKAGCDVEILDNDGWTGHQWADMSAPAHRNGLLQALDTLEENDCENGIEEACPPHFWIPALAVGVCGWLSYTLW